MTPHGRAGVEIADIVLRNLAVLPSIPRVVGIAGPQGSGKSTVASEVSDGLRRTGLTTAILSLDDLYLTKGERADLAALIHPLLATRGPPGTHDLALGHDVLDRLGFEGDTAVPRFNKAVDDRVPVAAWVPVAGPIDVVIVEGWCLGAKAQPVDALAGPINALERDEDVDGAWRRFTNTALATDYPAFFERADFLVYLAPPSFDVVFDWRREQERALRESSGSLPGVMDDGQLDRFIQHYERLTRWMIETLPAVADLTIQLDASRQAVATSARSSRFETAFNGIDGS